MKKICLLLLLLCSFPAIGSLSPTFYLLIQDDLNNSVLAKVVLTKDFVRNMDALFIRCFHRTANYSIGVSIGPNYLQRYPTLLLGPNEEWEIGPGENHPLVLYSSEIHSNIAMQFHGGNYWIWVASATQYKLMETFESRRGRRLFPPRSSAQLVSVINEDDYEDGLPPFNKIVPLNTVRCFQMQGQ